MIKSIHDSHLDIMKHPVTVYIVYRYIYVYTYNIPHKNQSIATDNHLEHILFFCKRSYCALRTSTKNMQISSGKHTKNIQLRHKQSSGQTHKEHPTSTSHLVLLVVDGESVLVAQDNSCLDFLFGVCIISIKCEICNIIFIILNIFTVHFTMFQVWNFRPS